MADPLSVLPEGEFPMRFAPSAFNAVTGGKKGGDDVVAFRYAFKPASVTSSTPGVLEPSSSGRVVSFDLPTGGSQVFDVREEKSKVRECVLVWDDENQSFVLYSLPSTLHLTQNRTLSAARVAGSSQVSRVGTPEAYTTERARKEPPPLPDEFEEPAPEPTPAPAAASTSRSRVSGKGLARKALPAGVAAITASEPPAPAKKRKTAAAAKKEKAEPKAKATKAKAAPKKTTPKKGKAALAKAAAASQVSAAKIKSVEIIEDSDDDMDEFADMLGAAVEQAGATTELPGYDDDEDEDEEDEEEDDELGGAQFAGYNRQEAEPDVEWI